jgi:hypothetical protein
MIDGGCRPPRPAALIRGFMGSGGGRGHSLAIMLVKRAPPPPLFSLTSYHQLQFLHIYKETK